MEQIREDPAALPLVQNGDGNNKKKRPLVQWVVFFGFLIMFSVLFLQFLLPNLAEKAIAKSFSPGLDVDIQTDIQAFPAWKLFYGSFDSMTMEAVFLHDTHPLSSFQAEWQGSDTFLKSVRAGFGALNENGPQKMTLVWDQRSFRRFLAAEQGFLSDIILEIKDDTVVVNAKTRLFGAEKEMDLTLRPSLNNEGKLVLVVEEADLADLSFDSMMKEKLTEALTFDLDILPFDWQIKAENVVIINNNILVTATGI